MSPFQDALLHCLKYSGQDVYGLFVSSPNNVVTCVPLVHTPCVSVPLLRTALSLVDELEDQRVIGMYFATNNPDQIITPVAKWIHSQLVSTLQPTPIVLWRYSSEVVEMEGVKQWPFTSYVIEDDKEVAKLQEVEWFDADGFRNSASTSEYATRIFTHQSSSK